MAQLTSLGQPPTYQPREPSGAGWSGERFDQPTSQEVFGSADTQRPSPSDSSALLLLLALRPFEIGDQIVIGDLEGAVERIELRATRLRADDGRVMLVPNAEVFTARLVTNTADPVRRGKISAWVGYDADLRGAVKVALGAAAKASGVLENPPPAVRIEDLGQDDITLEITFWTDSQCSDYKNTASAVRSSVVEAFRDAGIGLPDPDLRVVSVVPARKGLDLRRSDPSAT